MTTGRRPVAPPFAAPIRQFAARLALLVFGLLVFALGITLTLRPELGYGPWWAFHYGMTVHLPMSIGQASILVGLVMIGLSWLIGVRPGIATPMNIFITGLATDFLIERRILPSGTGGLDSYVLLLMGVVVTGLGTAIYVKAELGAGPRDSFMLGLAGHLRGRVGLARNAMEVTVTFLGWLMGAPIGVGTLIFAVVLGPVIAFWFRILRVRAHRRRPPSSVPA